MRTTKELLEDIEFLTSRLSHGGIRIPPEPERDYGASSDSLVAIAYGLPVAQELPFDRYDLAACERMWKKLPLHRKTPGMMALMDKARSAI